MGQSCFALQRRQAMEEQAVQPHCSAALCKCAVIKEHCRPVSASTINPISFHAHFIPCIYVHRCAAGQCMHIYPSLPGILKLSSRLGLKKTKMKVCWPVEQLAGAAICSIREYCSLLSLRQAIEEQAQQVQHSSAAALHCSTMQVCCDHRTMQARPGLSLPALLIPFHSMHSPLFSS